MKLDIFSYDDILISNVYKPNEELKSALYSKGIVGIKNIPNLINFVNEFIDSAREFAALDSNTKNQYTPNRLIGITEGYELGAEKFKSENGTWQIDDKKASYYAYVPNSEKNIWPSEVKLRAPYLELGELIFHTGKLVMQAIGLTKIVGIDHHKLVGYGRMLHYIKEEKQTNYNPDWCGAHFDHGVFTGLIPAHYYCNGQKVEEPKEAGLFIVPTGKQEFEKVEFDDPNILLFQVGEFGQLASNDKIRATKHKVCKSLNGIERFAFALFYSALDDVTINSESYLSKDSRYNDNKNIDASIEYGKWQKASFNRYLVES